MYLKNMQVIKRDGTKQQIFFDKILNRVTNLTLMEPQLLHINTALLTQKVIAGLKDDILTTQLDELAADAAIFLSTTHYNYSVLASRIVVSNLHKQTSPCFLTTCENIKHLLSQEYLENVKNNIDVIQNVLDYTLDYQYDFFGFKILCKSYLFKKDGQNCERPQHMLMRVALGIHGNDIENALKSYYYMSHKYFTHATPTLFNAGTPTPQLASCFLMTMIDDSVEGIYDSVKRSAIISKYSGGQGVSVHDIRCEGSRIRSNDGEAGGLIPMLKLFNDCACHINQASKRRGSISIYLEPHHPDIEDFLELKKNTGKEEKRCRDLFFALWNSDLFMQRVEENKNWSLFCPSECPGLSEVHGAEFVALYEKYEKEGRAWKTIKAQELWSKIVTSQMETGGPYMLYKDQINSHNNQSNLGTIKSSNLCVSGDTFILTDKGQIPIRHLQDQEVNVWNGEEWSATTVRKTGENQELVNVTLSNGVSIKCTPYHKFHITDGKRYPKTEIVEASQLKPNHALIRYKLPSVVHFDKSELKYPYMQGFFAGDGTYGAPNKKRPIIYLYGEKKELLIHMTYRTMSAAKDGSRLNLILNKEDLTDKFYVPMNECVDTKLRWFEGYCDADGTITKGKKNETNEGLQIGSIEFEFLMSVKLMLQLLGIDSKVTKNKDAEMRSLPDHKGGSKEYYCKTIYRILISANELHKLANIGFAPKRLKFAERIPQRKADQFIRVVDVKPLDEREDTFCFNESKKHLGMFNGVLSGNCTEVTEYTAPDEVSVCTLASLGLPSFIVDGVFDHQKLYDACYYVTLNLNKVIDVNFYPITEARYSNLKHRPIGIGIQGLADCFFILKYPYDSPEAKVLNQEILETMYFASATCSNDLAKKYGVYESYVGSPASKGILTPDMWGHTPTNRWNYPQLRENVKTWGLRNSLLISLMPTASTASILNFVESFDCLTNNLYTRRVLAGEFILTNKYLMKDLMSLGLWNEQMKQKIIEHNGSIQNIAEIPNDIKQIYRTVWEVPMKSLIDMSSDRNPFVCQSQSFNCYMSAPNKAKLTSMHFYAWKKGLKTGMYYLRTNAAAGALQFTVVKEEEKKEPLKEALKVCEEDVCDMCGA